MNKLKSAITPLIAYIIITFLSLGQLSAHTNEAASADYVPKAPRVSKEVIQERLDNLSSVIDVRYSTEVGRRIKEYTYNYRVAGEKILGRIDLYFPMFENELHSRNLPDALKYVAVVESHLDVTAKSKSGAVGIWQFMKSTAQMQGLIVNKHLDERKDPVLATKAALDYLEAMYDQFGDWTLAVAAYNCGPGGVRKAIRRSGKNDYWSLRKYLPKETQKYVPRIIAAMYLMQYYHSHDLQPKSVSEDLSNVTTVADGKGHNLVKLSEQLGLESNILILLNNKYITGYFPKNTGEIELRIPVSVYDRYLELHAPEAYKEYLAKRRDEELSRIKDSKKIIMREQLAPVDKIKQLTVDRVRQKHRPKKIYKLKLS